MFGWIAGENAARYAQKSPMPTAETEARIEEKTVLIDALQCRDNGPDWRDANMALQQIMSDYAGLIRSEAMLKAGLSYLQRLKKKIYGTIRASNRWELTRCLEVLNLYDVGELVVLSALERRESRGLHVRVDYPLTDPLLNDKVLVVKNIDDKPVFDWKNK